MNKRKEKRKSISLLILFLFLLGIGGLFLGVLYPRISYRDENTQSIVLPTIQVSLKSSDGKSHDLQAKFTVHMDESQVGQVSRSELTKHITEILSTLDYEGITGSNGISYIKSEVQQQLSRYMDPNQLQGIYITHVLTGDSLIPPDEGEINSNPIFQQLFPNAH